jgi:hypothetical protein
MITEATTYTRFAPVEKAARKTLLASSASA